MIFNEVIKTIDCSVLEGNRSEAQQRENIEKGVSWTMRSKHLRDPSHAVDVAPYPIDWNDIKRFKLFAAFVFATAKRLKISIRYGATWSRNPTDKYTGSHSDHPHFELIPKR